MKDKIKASTEGNAMMTSDADPFSSDDGVLMKVDAITTRAPFNDLLPICNATLCELKAHMRIYGFDPAHPLVLWREGGCLIKGHTRLMAARAAEVEEVSVVYMSFASEQDALDYVIHHQCARRHTPRLNVALMVKVLDQRQTRGGDHRSQASKSKASNGAAEPAGKSAQRLAKILGVSRATIERARFVLDHGDAEIQAAALRGAMTIHAACAIIHGWCDGKQDPRWNQVPW